MTPNRESYRFRAAGTVPAVAAIAAQPKYKCSLLELWNKFTDYQETQIEQTTILNRYIRVLRYTQRLPTYSLEDAVKIRDYLLITTTRQMAWILVNHYSQCCRWAVTSQLIPDNPFEPLKTKEPKKKLVSTQILLKSYSKFVSQLSLHVFIFYPQPSGIGSIPAFCSGIWTFKHNYS